MKKKTSTAKSQFLMRKPTLLTTECKRLYRQDQLQAVLRGRGSLLEEEETAEDRQHDQKITDDLEKSFEMAYPDRLPNFSLVGDQAVTGFYRHYKQLSRVRDQNKSENIRSSVYTSVLEKCEELRVLPSKVGVVKYAGRPDEVKLNGSRYGKKYLAALSEGMKDMNLTSCHLNSNRIDQQTLEMLAPNLPRSVMSMRLQNNQIGSKGIEAFHRFLKEDIKLVELDLSGNNLTDAGTATLCGTLHNHQRIRVLNLSRNCITCKSAGQISSLVHGGCLEELYLRWNRIRCKGGKQILEALLPSMSVKVFDMSWNLIGGGNDSCEALCNLLRGNTELIHCDFSGNSFSLQECKQIAEGLQLNTTIYGFHFKGNFGFVDARGNLQVEESLHARDYREVSLHNRIDCRDMWQHTKKDFCDAPSLDCCWICEGWLQKEITFESNCEPNLDLWVHFSFEGYRSRYLGRIQERTHKFTVMVPPRKVYFFFTYNDEQVVSRVHGSVCLYENSLVRGMQLAGERLDCHVEDRNVFFKEPSGKVVDAQYKILVEVPPREAETPYQRTQTSKPIRPQQESTEVESEEDRLQAFQNDWLLMKVQNLLANDQAPRIRSALLSCYGVLRKCYRYYSCLCTTDPNGFFMDLEALNMFLLDSAMLDDELTLDEVMNTLKEIIKASQKDLDGTSYPYDAITSFRLLELLVRLAPLKYPQYEHCEGLELLLLSLKKKGGLIEPHEKFQRCIYRPEQCDSLLRRNKTRLEQLFFDNCSSYWRLGQKKFIYFEDFKDIFERNRTCETFELAVKQLRLAFFYAKQATTDDYISDGYRRLYLSEFPEAIARAAWLSDCTAYRENHLIGVTQKLRDIVASITAA